MIHVVTVVANACACFRFTQRVLACYVLFLFIKKKFLFNVIGKRWEKVFGRYMHFTSDSYVKYYTILLYINFSLIF